jgi:type II secretory pathway pseudopilin PulG
MLVVIAIIGLLSTVLISTYSHVKETARKSQAQNLVAEVAVAFTRYLQEERSWSADLLSKQEMDEAVCLFLQKGKYLDVTPYKVDADGNVTTERNWASLDRFGLLDPWAQNALKKNSTKTATDKVRGSQRTFADHRLQYCLDVNLDGIVDREDGAPPGVSVRASAIVWSRGLDGFDDFDPRAKAVRYPKDDNLSWPHGQYKGSGN